MRTRMLAAWRGLSGAERHRLTLLAALLLLTLANCLVSIRWGLPDGASPESTAPWAVDTIAPMGPLNEAYHRFDRSGEEAVIYPVFHFVVLATADAPYIVACLLTGKLQHPTSSYPY